MTSILDLITQAIPPERFITKTLLDKGEERPPLAQRDTRRLVLYLRRRTIGPMINRQDNDGDTIRANIGGIDHVRVPARKWKSAEKIRGLHICKAYDLVKPEYRYNEIANVDLLDNPVSVLFGDSVTKEKDSGAIPSLVVYEQGLSVEPVVKATERLQHNALSDEGTMWDRTKGKFRESLFDTLYVREGVSFLQSITLDAPTPEGLAFVLMTLDANRYGAGKQVLGTNVRNEVVGILATSNEPPVTPYTVLEEAPGASADKATELYTQRAQAWGGTWVEGHVAEELRDAIRKDPDGRKEVMLQLGEASKAYHRYVYAAKEGKGRRGKAKGQPANEE